MVDVVVAVALFVVEYVDFLECGACVDHHAPVVALDGAAIGCGADGWDGGGVRVWEGGARAGGYCFGGGCPAEALAYPCACAFAPDFAEAADGSVEAGWGGDVGLGAAVQVVIGEGLGCAVVE